MSRIGKMPVMIPGEVKVEIKSGSIVVSGPKGKLSQDILPEIEMSQNTNVVNVKRKNNSKKAMALHGLYRSLIKNMVIGVSKGFSRVLTIIGVGYRANMDGKNLTLNLGFSNPINYIIPDDITIAVEGNTKIIVNGINKEKVGRICAEIRALRPPEPYKGKGVRYENEVVRRKIGKSGIK